MFRSSGGWGRGDKSCIQSIKVSRHVTVPAFIQVNISDLSVASVAAVWGQTRGGGGVNANCVSSHSIRVRLLLQFKSVVQRQANLSLSCCRALAAPLCGSVSCI